MADMPATHNYGGITATSDYGAAPSAQASFGSSTPQAFHSDGGGCPIDTDSCEPFCFGEYWWAKWVLALVLGIVLIVTLVHTTGRESGPQPPEPPGVSNPKGVQNWERPKPPTPEQCTANPNLEGCCEDYNVFECAEWQKQGQCERSAEVKQICMESCRIGCTREELEPTGPALPPAAPPPAPPVVAPPPAPVPPPVTPCVDENVVQCPLWAGVDPKAPTSQCMTNPAYMEVDCKKSCGLC